MKYSAINPPVVCLQTTSTCYRQTGKMAVKGILLHSTGANNPTLKRYVQPADNATDRAKMLALLGVNPNRNDYNHITTYEGVNAFIGKTAAGDVAAVQTLPWDFAPWGCGSGVRGSCNNGWVQLEICEDGLTDKAYFEKIYQEAAELTAYLCQRYGLDPNGTTTLNGVKVPVILDHKTSHALGLGSNHGDVGHWFPRHGKNLETFRADVASLLKVTTTAKPVTTATGSASGLEYPEGAIKHREMYQLLREAGLTEIGAAALMGNLYAESGLAANNLQNNGNTRLGVSDEEFTKRLDSGAYTRAQFIGDGYGYGLAQWTYSTRKAALYDYMRKAGKSLGDAVIQIAFLIQELKTSYKVVWAALTGGAKTLREASDIVMTRFEAPADQSEKRKQERAEYGQEFYDKYASTKPSAPYLVWAPVGTAVLNIRQGPGTSYPIAGKLDVYTQYTITETSSDWGKLKSGVGWIHLGYTKKA